MTYQPEPTIEQSEESVQLFAYGVMYEAFRGGALKKFNLVFSAEEQIESADAFQAMADQVYRNAVASGQANSLEDIAITSVSLLNPVNYAVPEQTTAAPQSLDYESSEYQKELEAAFIKVSDQLSMMAIPDAVIDYEEVNQLLDKTNLIYSACKDVGEKPVIEAE